MTQPIKILCFSRGRGHGHALDDMAIAKELSSRGKYAFVFASYATGAKTLRSVGIDVIDMNMPDDNRYLETLNKAYNIVRTVEPHIVIAHEEFAAIPAAAMRQRPSIFISSWLPPGATLLWESLQYCHSAVIMCDPGVFCVMNGFQHVHFVGHMVRQFPWTRDDRPRLRKERGIDENVFVISVVTGGWASEDRAPIAPCVLAAYRRLAIAEKRLLWLGSTDADKVRNLAGETNGVSVLGFERDVGGIIALSDLVITKGTLGATLEAASLGVPSLSLSYRQNPVDELLVPRIRSNLALNAQAVDDGILCDYIERCRNDPLWRHPPALKLHHNGASNAAERIGSEIKRILFQGNDRVVAEVLDEAYSRPIKDLLFTFPGLQ